jgi:hypothetical protein
MPIENMVLELVFTIGFVIVPAGTTLPLPVFAKLSLYVGSIVRTDGHELLGNATVEYKKT